MPSPNAIDIALTQSAAYLPPSNAFHAAAIAQGAHLLSEVHGGHEPCGDGDGEGDGDGDGDGEGDGEGDGDGDGDGDGHDLNGESPGANSGLAQRNHHSSYVPSEKGHIIVWYCWHVSRLQKFDVPSLVYPGIDPYSNAVHLSVLEHIVAHSSMLETGCAPPPTPAILLYPGQSAVQSRT